jgi:hypothetical protein
MGKFSLSDGMTTNVRCVFAMQIQFTEYETLIFRHIVFLENTGLTKSFLCKAPFRRYREETQALVVIYRLLF